MLAGKLRWLVDREEDLSILPYRSIAMCNARFGGCDGARRNASEIGDENARTAAATKTLVLLEEWAIDGVAPTHIKESGSLAWFDVHVSWAADLVFDHEQLIEPGAHNQGAHRLVVCAE